MTLQSVLSYECTIPLIIQVPRLLEKRFQYMNESTHMLLFYDVTGLGYSMYLDT